MPVYYSMLILSILTLLFGGRTYQAQYVLGIGYEYKTKPAIVYFTLIYIAFFVSLRDYVLDTYAYISIFNDFPTDFSEIILIVKGQSASLYFLVQGFFKKFISRNHYVWLASLCVISLFSLFRTYKKYTCDYALTFFLFIASTTFTWLLNGTRQFLVACVLFAFCEWMLRDKRHKLFYLLLIFILSYVHKSCIFLLPISIICSRGKLLDKWMFLFVVATIIGTMSFESLVGVTTTLMGKEYETLHEESGSNIIRLFVSLIPVALVTLKLSTVKKTATPLIILSINMSLVGACFYFASTFTSGILVGRMPIYFTVYNFILLPWLLKTCYRSDLLRIGCIVCFCIYFYVQMVVTWHNLPYVSYVLGIS